MRPQMKLKTYQVVFLIVLCVFFLRVSGCIEEDDGNDQKVTPKESFQKVITELMTRWGIPGGAVACVNQERLVLAEGYGFAEKEKALVSTPESLFRIASLSKPITAVAVLKLYERGLLSLDEKAFEILKDLKPPQGATVDPRIYNITVRDLLQHSGGWDSDRSFDPMFESLEIAKKMGVRPPADAVTIIRYMLGQPLDFTPGARYAYSNFGYCVLGRIIEKVTGQGYESFVKAQVLKPMGISRMSIGHTLLKDRADKEVIYYDYPGAALTQSVFPDGGQMVPWPYGGFYLDAMDAHGGWIASIVDLMRFLTAVDGRSTRPDFLQASTINLMVSRPALPDWQNSSWYYALGWQVRPQGSDANWWHQGSLPGTSTILVRTYRGLSWVALFNLRPQNADTFFIELDDSLWKAVNQVTEWPTYDLFANYPILE